MSKYRICLVGAKLCLRPIILFLDKMVRKPFYRRINILCRLRRKKQYYTAFLGGKAAMPLISGIIKRSIRFIRNKYNTVKRYYKKVRYLWDYTEYEWLLCHDSSCLDRAKTWLRPYSGHRYFLLVMLYLGLCLLKVIA